MTQAERTDERPAKLLQVQIHPDLVTRLRVAALVRETSASAIVAELIEQYLPAPPVVAEPQTEAPAA